MNSSIMGAVRDFLGGCPLFDGNTLRVNFLGEEPQEYTLEDVPATPILKKYQDGSSVRQALFILASRELYSRDAVENLKASGFYEQLADWLDAQNFQGNLPKLPEGMAARKIEATTSGYCIAADIQQSAQRYQIQLRLVYEKGAESCLL